MVRQKGQSGWRGGHGVWVCSGGQQILDVEDLYLIAECSVQKAFIAIVLGYPVATGPSLLTSNSNMGSVAGELPSVHRVDHPRMPESVESRDLEASWLRFT